ncbi:AAHS family 4-hydroxybenzoate transporter-like MFS transporter [Plasticicumulans lactativorans]|uniref:AAHS family 4-hydroxybenzoate transporter-like MFS transporter n=1 Tax=Plasticicumulans lactativorans TaxID=1133106 RepID=A0A4R2L1M6_9GAMM|nr:aromatic acid/H+ symport family MFS transporter [Plasticicumulans lactativorans]TCO80931.1 AAHS family 4-hydroxybenzoate transporter-like MFS transporter [Plasticicumulans lactativorans]
MQHRLDVQDFIDNHRFSGLQWRVLGFCFLVVALDGLDTAAIGFIAPALVQEWGIPRESLGPVLSAALVGLALGALIAGPLADRFGRKAVIVWSVVFFGLGSLASALAGSVGELTLLRLLTGIGCGAAMPNATTLMSEYAPAKHRSVLVTTMFCGFTLGSAAGGFLAAKLIPLFGWHSVLLLGGVLPLVFALALLRWLPESARFLVLRQRPAAEVAAILRRIEPALPETTEFVIHDQLRHAGKTDSSIATVLSPELRFGTAMLWLAYFMGLAVFYLLTGWLPTLVKSVGFPFDQAAMVGAMLPVGGTVGAILCGWLMDRLKPQCVIALAYAAGAGLIYVLSRHYTDLTTLLWLVFGTGVCVSGAQTSLSALAAGFYPTQGRATGVAWMLGFGRFGAIFGTLLGGVMLGAGWHFSNIFAILALPTLVAAAAIGLKGLRYRAPGVAGA